MTNTYAIRVANGKATEVAIQLAYAGCDVSQPMCRRLKRARGARRQHEVEEPILSNYVFCSFPPEKYRDVKDTKHVIPGGLFPLRGRDIEDLNRFMAQAERGDFDHSGPYGHLRPGQIMVMVGGLFEGMQFSFERVRNERLEGLIETSMGFIRASVDLDSAEVA